MPTTFVVGAGASHRLPAGAGLKDEALSLRPNTPRFELLLDCGIDRGHLEAVLNELRRDITARSIDEFLEQRQHRRDVTSIGRTLIAALLGLVMAETRGDDRYDDDWLGRVIGRMREGTRTCGEFVERNANLRFVTFNFDDQIERRLAKEARAIFPDAVPEDLRRVDETFRVVHVHGRLSEPPPIGALRDAVTGRQAWVDWTKRGAEAVRVVHDDIAEEDVAAAVNAVRSAEVICFLGFAYATTNLLRLGLPDTAKVKDGYRFKHVFGSAFGLGDGDRRKLAERFTDEIHLGAVDKKCRDVLDHFYVLRD